MLLNSLRLLHVCFAAVGLLSGFLAMVFRKGSGLHGAAGTVFFVSMLSASGAGAFIAAFLHPISANVMGSTLTFYLVATGWVAATRKDGKPGIFDLGALLFVLAIGAAGATWGLEAASSQTGSKDGYPTAFYFVFGSIAMLFAASDVRMLVRGGVFGAKRIARHLFRMCLALLFALFSFYPGQGPRFFSKWLRATSLPYVPHILVAGVMIFWLYRVSVRKLVPQNRVTRARQGDAVSTRIARLETHRAQGAHV
jgi:hypothetical protein